MDFEIWYFYDDQGGIGHLQDRADRYEAFMRHVEWERTRGGMTAEILHCFQADSLEEAIRIYREFLGYE